MEPSETPVLAILEILSEEIFKKIRNNKDLHLYFDNRYKIDDNGHIIGINLPCKEDVYIVVFPHEICNLKHLEELYLQKQGIRKVPQCISELKNLRRLDLRWNNINTLPKSLKNLNLLEVFT